MTPKTETNGLKKYLVGVAVWLTGAVIFQTGALVWWAGGITKEVQYIRRDVDSNTARLERIERPAMRVPTARPGT